MRMTIRIVAVLGLLASVGFGVPAAYHWLTPSDEDEYAESKAREAAKKTDEAKQAKDAAERVKLQQEALDLMQSARLWAEGARDRLGTNRLAVIACAAGLVLSAAVLFLTRKRKAVPETA